MSPWEQPGSGSRTGTDQSKGTGAGWQPRLLAICLSLLMVLSMGATGTVTAGGATAAEATATVEAGQSAGVQGGELGAVRGAEGNSGNGSSQSTEGQTAENSSAEGSEEQDSPGAGQRSGETGQASDAPAASTSLETRQIVGYDPQTGVYHNYTTAETPQFYSAVMPTLPDGTTESDVSGIRQTPLEGDENITDRGITDEYPWSAVGTLPGCSGALIDDSHVLTAAHCVYNTTTDEWTVTSFSAFKPGKNMSREPFGSSQVSFVQMYEEYIDAPEWADGAGFDLAVVTLAGAPGSETGTFGYETHEPGPPLVGPYRDDVHITGYPSSAEAPFVSQRNEQWDLIGDGQGTNLDLLAGCRFNDRCQTYGTGGWFGETAVKGVSGAPVWQGAGASDDLAAPKIEAVQSGIAGVVDNDAFGARVTGDRYYQIGEMVETGRLFRDVDVEITDVDGQAGGVDSPQPVTAEVEVTANGDPYPKEMNGESFYIAVGDTVVTGDILAETSEPGVYTLRFVPPSQPSPGEYDLTVEVVRTDTDTRAEAITYGEGERTQIAASLQIDVSGSMSGILDEAKQGGGTFVQRADDSDYVSVVGYGTESRIDHSLVQLTQGRQSLLSAIEGLDTRGLTNTGDALEDGLDTLDSAPDGTIQAGIHMTDGQLQTSEWSREEILNRIVPQYNSRGVCLYTIGFTSEADEEFMQDLVEAADCGDYRFAGEEGEVQSIQNTLQAVFSDIEGDVADAETFRTDSGTLDSGASYTRQAGIDGSVSQATTQIRIEGVDFSAATAGDPTRTIQTTAVDPSVSDAVSLRRPDGTELDGSSQRVAVSVVGDSVIYRIEEPVPGEWSYTLQNPRSQPSEFAVDITGDAQTSLNARVDADTYHQGDEAEIVASLIGPSGQIDGATVAAVIEQPDGSTKSASLTEQSPGIYAGTVELTAEGSYSARVSAESGTLSRQQSVSWTVSGSPPLSLTQITAPTITQGGSGTVELSVTPSSTTASTAELGGGLAVESRAEQSVRPTFEPGGPNFELSDLEPANPIIESGEEIQPSVFIANTGDEDGTQTIKYRIGGTRRSEGDVQLDRGFGGRIGLSEAITVSLEPGEYQHGFYSENDSATGTLTVGDEFGITLEAGDLRRVGGGGTIPSQAVEIDPRSVNSDQSSTPTLTVSVPSSVPAGQYEGTVSAYTSDGQVVTESITLSVSGRAAFDVEIIDSDTTVAAGEEIGVTAQVTNTGATGGEAVVDLTVPELDSEKASVTLGSGDSTTVTLTVPTSADDSGSYDVGVTSGDGSDVTSVSVSGETGVATYANGNGVVDTAGLRGAIADWRTGVIETSLLRDVIDAWRTGETVA